jgi:hypothetical protein
LSAAFAAFLSSLIVFSLPWRTSYVGLVGVRAVDAQALARQVAHVAVRREDLEILAEELLERLRFGGRLDDDEGLRHSGRWTLS